VQAASFSGRDDTRFVASLPGGTGVAQAVGFRSPEDQGVLGRIEIPRLGLKAIILEGVSQRTLALAVDTFPERRCRAKGRMLGSPGIAIHSSAACRGFTKTTPSC